MSTPEELGAAAAPATPPPAEPETRKGSPTEYVILSSTSVGDKTWRVEGNANGHGAESAIRVFLKGIPEPSGCYLAVPVRSWNPLTPAVETQTKLTFK